MRLPTTSGYRAFTSVFVTYLMTVHWQSLAWSNITMWEVSEPARSRASSICWRRRRTRYLRVHMDYQQYVNHHTKNVHATSSGQYMGAVSWTLSFIQQFPFYPYPNLFQSVHPCHQPVTRLTYLYTFRFVYPPPYLICHRSIEHTNIYIFHAVCHPSIPPVYANT